MLLRPSAIDSITLYSPSNIGYGHARCNNTNPMSVEMECRSLRGLEDLCLSTVYVLECQSRCEAEPRLCGDRGRPKVKPVKNRSPTSELKSGA